MKILVLVIGAALLIGAFALSAPPPAIVPSVKAATPPSAAVEIQMRNVGYRIARDVELEVRTVRGRMRRVKPDRPVNFDDNESFVVEIDTGEVAITPASLSALLNSYVLPNAGVPIKDVRVTIEGGRMVQKGTLRKGIGIPFEIEGPISATPQGEIRMHADKVKAAHIPVKGLLKLFGEDLGKLVHGKPGRGLRVEGDDLILSPSGITPPPHLEGRVVRVSLEDGKIVQVFDSGKRPAALRPPLEAEGYIYHRGSVLQFGRLTMDDADLEIVGDKSRGRFEFFLKEYNRQLVAGYSKNTPNGGLVVHMLDYTQFR